MCCTCSSFLLLQRTHSGGAKQRPPKPAPPKLPPPKPEPPKSRKPDYLPDDKHNQEDMPPEKVSFIKVEVYVSFCCCLSFLLHSYKKLLKFCQVQTKMYLSMVNQKVKYPVMMIKHK